LRIEDGRRWGDAAYDFQIEDAKAIISGKPPYNYLTRARGKSKTTDQAGLALVLLLTAGALERIYWIAADKEQGELAIDAIKGFADRTPGLAGLITIGASWVEARASGARIDVLPADAASSWGLKPAAVFADELTMWPETSG